MNCFVTGAGGFAGCFLTELLRRRGHPVKGIRGRRSADEEFSACDLRHARKLDRLIEESSPDWVFHLAAVASPANSLRNPRRCFQVNLQGTVNLLDALRRYRPKAGVLIVSSCQVYRGGPSHLNEHAPTEPLTPYASSKLLAEQVAWQYAHRYGQRVIVARPFNHAGPGQSAGYVLSDFCRQIALAEVAPAAGRFVRTGNLDPVLDFSDVRDVTQAYLALAEKGRAGETYNVCSGRGIAIGRLLEICLAEAKVSVTVQAPHGGPGPPEPRQLIGDNGKLLSHTGWNPSIPLRKTVSDTLDSWRLKVGSG